MGTAKSCCLVGKASWSCSKWERRGATPTQCRIEQITFIDEQRYGNKLKINYELSSLGRFPYFLGAGRKLLSPGEDSILCSLMTYFSLSSGLTMPLYCISSRWR